MLEGVKAFMNAAFGLRLVVEAAFLGAAFFAGAAFFGAAFAALGAAFFVAFFAAILNPPLDMLGTFCVLMINLD